MSASYTKVYFFRNNKNSASKQESCDEKKFMKEKFKMLEI
jgi:hypothetical protein